MSKPTINIRLDYYKGLFDEDELRLHKYNLQQIGFGLICNDKTGKMFLFLDQYTNQVSLIFSNQLVQAYMLGLLTNASYDTLKRSIVWMWNSLIGKKITKLKTGGECEDKDATFGFSVRIDEMTKVDFRLYGDVSDELKIQCVDKAFKIIPTIQKGKFPNQIDWFAEYNWDLQKWCLYNTRDEIRKKMLSMSNNS